MAKRERMDPGVCHGGTTRVLMCSGGTGDKRNRYVSAATYDAIRDKRGVTCRTADRMGCFFGNQFTDHFTGDTTRVAYSERKRRAEQATPRRKAPAPADPQERMQFFEDRFAAEDAARVSRTATRARIFPKTLARQETWPDGFVQLVAFGPTNKSFEGTLEGMRTGGSDDSLADATDYARQELARAKRELRDKQTRLATARAVYQCRRASKRCDRVFYGVAAYNEGPFRKWGRGLLGHGTTTKGATIRIGQDDSDPDADGGSAPPAPAVRRTWAASGPDGPTDLELEHQMGCATPPAGEGMASHLGPVMLMDPKPRRGRDTYIAQAWSQKIEPGRKDGRAWHLGAVKRPTRAKAIDSAVQMLADALEVESVRGAYPEYPAHTLRAKVYRCNAAGTCVQDVAPIRAISGVWGTEPPANMLRAIKGAGDRGDPVAIRGAEEMPKRIQAMRDRKLATVKCAAWTETAAPAWYRVER